MACDHIALEEARVNAVKRELMMQDKLIAAKKALAAIAASKCECAGCVMVRAIVSFMEEV